MFGINKFNVKKILILVKTKYIWVKSCITY